MSLAAVTDVTTRMGRPTSSFTSDQLAQIQMLLDDAESMLVSRIPLLLTQGVADPLTYDNVIRIEAMAVRRVMLNPGAFLQENIDGWEGIRSRLLSDGLLFFTDDEWAVLLPTIESRGRGSIPLIAYGEYPRW
jgi:hypothetical protein